MRTQHGFVAKIEDWLAIKKMGAQRRRGDRHHRGTEYSANGTVRALRQSACERVMNRMLCVACTYSDSVIL